MECLNVPVCCKFCLGVEFVDVGANDEFKSCFERKLHSFDRIHMKLFALPRFSINNLILTGLTMIYL